MKAINSFDPAIRVSRTDQELLLAVRRTQAELAGELGGTPTDEQIASRFDVSLDDLRHDYRLSRRSHRRHWMHR